MKESKKICGFLLVLPALLVPAFSAAQQFNGCRAAGDERKTQVYFSNGIQTTAVQAALSALEIQDAYASTVSSNYPEDIFVFSSSYNATNGLIDDLNEVLLQRLTEDGLDSVLESWHLAVWLGLGLSIDQIRDIIVDLVDDPTLALSVVDAQWIEALHELLASQTSLWSEERMTHQTHVLRYSNALLAGQRVIIFAHSQGNLFANSAAQSVTQALPNESAGIAVIGIATPASRVIGSNTYVTAHDDRVIDALRVISSVLPSNIDNDPGIIFDNRGWLNHNFSSAYFSTVLASRSWIDDQFINHIVSLPFPGGQLGEGALRATLSWGSQPDVDLHAFEPSGAHVYYANRFGVSGTLDRDDTNGFGPENYFVACDQIEVGTYTIGINYYRGSAPETAVVQLVLGDGQVSAPRSVQLTQSVGSSGNSNPIVLFTVEVSLDEESGSVVYEVL